MTRTTIFAFAGVAGVAGALAAYLVMGEHIHYSFFKAANDRFCNDQATFKVLEGGLPKDGNSFYDSKRELCVYKFLNPQGIPDEITWNP